MAQDGDDADSSEEESEGSLLDDKTNAHITLERGKVLVLQLTEDNPQAQFNFPLPSKPFAVHVEVQILTTTEPIPSIRLFASTEIEKPSETTCQLKGALKPGEPIHQLTYQHAQWDDDNQLIAPRASNLFLLVQRSNLDVDVQITVRFAKAKIRMSAEQLKRLQASRAGCVIENKIRELQNNPDAYTEFQAHVRRIRQEKRKKLLETSRDALKLNIENACKTPRDNWEDTKERIYSARSRRILALEKKEELDAKKSESARAWTMRSELKKEKEKKDAEDAVRIERLKEWQSRWLAIFSVASFSVNVATKWRATMEIIKQRSKETAAVSLMESAWLRCYCYRRQRQLYTNLMRFQRCIVTVTRHCRLAELYVAQGTLLRFLRAHSLRSNTMTGTGLTMMVRTYLGRIKKTQRRWRTIKLMRETRAAMLEPYFRVTEAELQVTTQKVKDVKRTSRRGSKSIEATSSRRNSKSIEAPSSRKSSKSKEAASSRKSSKSIEAASSKKSSKSKEPAVLMPEHVVREALYEYAVRREKEFPAVIAKWEQKQQEEKEHHEFTVFSSDQESLMKFKWTRRNTPLDFVLIHSLPEEMERFRTFVQETLESAKTKEE